jgi:hypothetical protein
MTNAELITQVHHSSFILHWLLFFLFVGGIDKASSASGQDGFPDRQSFLCLEGCLGFPGGFALVTLGFGAIVLDRDRFLTTFQSYDIFQVAVSASRTEFLRFLLAN